MEKKKTLLDAMAELPETLYHYTSMAGLLGIVQSGQIWASHIRYLNDRTEQEHIWSLIQSRVRDKLAETSEHRVKTALEMLLADAGQRSSSDTFVASFSADGNLLSQWLSYCPFGNGYSIGFSRWSMLTNLLAQTKKMNELVAAGAPVDSEKMGWLNSVFYFSAASPNSTHNPVSVDALIDIFSGTLALPERLVKLKFTELTEPFRSYLENMFTAPNIVRQLIHMLEPIVKDSCFEAEKECRLVLHDPREIFFRPGKSMLIPYTKYDLSLGEGYFIERVIVGPCPDPDLSERSVKMLFQSLGQHSVEVIKGAIPYRSW